MYVSQDFDVFKHSALNWSTPGQIACISQPIFSYGFSWMKIFLLWLKLNWSVFLTAQLTITQHWFRDDNPFSEPVVTWFTDIYIRHWGEMNFTNTNRDLWLLTTLTVLIVVIKYINIEYKVVDLSLRRFIEIPVAEIKDYFTKIYFSIM